MTFSVLAIELYFVFLIAVGLRRWLSYFTAGKWWSLSAVVPESSFNQFAKNSFWLNFLMGSWERWMALATGLYQVRRWTLRQWSFAICIGHLATILFLAVLVALMVWFSELGLFLELTKWAMAKPSQEMVLWLTNSSWNGVVVGFLIGLGFGLLFRRCGISALVATLFLFPGLMSIATGIFLVLGELTALWFIFASQIKSPAGKKVYLLRLTIWIMVLGLYLLFGETSVHFYQGLFKSSGQPYNAVLVWFLSWCTFLFIDLVASSVAFHFVLRRKYKELSDLDGLQSHWPAIQSIKTWLTPYAVVKFREMAKAKVENLKAQFENADPEVRARIPEPVLRLGKAEITEAQDFLKSVDDLT